MVRFVHILLPESAILSVVREILLFRPMQRDISKVKQNKLTISDIVAKRTVGNRTKYSKLCMAKLF